MSEVLKSFTPAQVCVAALQFTAGLPGSGGKNRHIFPLLDRDFFEHPVLESLKSLPSLSAGITHFCTGQMRSWGRDSMISLRGLITSTGRHEYARSVLVATAAMLWNGLLPNLLDSGHSPRYNCRDSCWWFLQALQDYSKLVPDGIKILKEHVPRLFLDSEPPVSQEKMVQKRTMLWVVLDILEHHANGISYREHNAGVHLDRDMHSEGFNVCIGVSATTGFVQGGHRLNCGTWMDKNGCGNTRTLRTFQTDFHFRSRIIDCIRQRWHPSHAPRRLSNRTGGAAGVSAQVACAAPR